MTKPVEITLPERTFICDENGKASVVFTITNISDESVELATSLDIEDDTETTMQKEWLDVKVESDWSLDSKATEQVTVNVNIPDTQALGDYKFKLTVYSKENPGDNFSTSEMICVKKQKVVVKEITDKKFPWWMVIAAVVLIIVAGAGWYFATTIKLPDVIGQSLQSARALLIEKEFNVTTESINISSSQAKEEKVENGQVYKQDPDAKDVSRVKKGSTIALKIASVEKPVSQYISLPNVTKMKLLAALQKLNKSGLEADLTKIKKQYNKTLAEDTVIGQIPNPKTTRRVKKGTKIILTISTKTMLMAPVILTLPQIKMYKAQFRNIETSDQPNK